MDSIIKQKLARIFAGQPPRALDLFSGCGGISLGFQRAGFSIGGAVELDPHAARSHGINFHGSSPAHSQPIDITVTSPTRLTELLGIGNLRDTIDIVTGGPPCQAFARVGRSKLREIDSHPQAFVHDPRAQLFHRYLAYVQESAPVALLMENVPDILNHGGHNVAEEICASLKQLGYVPRYTLLNAALYGVPQMRERMFLVAYHKELNLVPVFPEPSHWVELPPGYTGSRNVALKALRAMDRPSEFYLPPPTASSSLQAAVSAAQALSDLPPINPQKQLEDGILGRSRADLNRRVRYRAVSQSDYQRDMRSWPGFEERDTSSAHSIRYLPRDYKIFSRMREGDQYPQAHALAQKMFREEVLRQQAMGAALKPNSNAFKLLQAKIVPPYDPGKFPNKWRKMWRDLPARTLMAHLGKDSYSHIHYSQGRTISVREAARLQSFPDGFIFHGAMNAAFKQIGNAVPPLMAYRLAQQIMSQLSEASTPHSEPA
ncbi:DNA cytosine methyltransferase [Stenotrophomonas sp. SrG]|uniref:DNA cytosine methyltransferase n=1 Tax=Stenotrophomonas sp. SrG TaxID=3414430 RepID=UPI003CEC38D0